jgi:hypothetical protein
MNVVGFDRHEALEVLIAQLPPAQRFPFGEVIGLTFHRFEASHPPRLENAPHPLELGCVDRIFAQRSHLVPCSARCVSHALGARFGVNHEYAELGWRVIVCGDRRDELSLPHCAVQP